MSRFKTDEELVDYVKIGFSDKFIFGQRDEDFIDVNLIFRDTVPETVRQDPITGANDLQEAKFAKMMYK